tara:strand:- start:158 stop:601 length:444 start_codon:yes stop_codon:yes gene_type:complete
MVANGNWKMKLKQAREMRVSASEALFERVKLLVEIFESDDYQQYCRDEQLDEMAELDGAVDDFSGSFATVMAVYKMNPDQDAWRKHGYRYLLAEYRQELADNRPKKERINWRHRYEEAQNTIIMLQGQVKSLREQVKTLEDRLIPLV